MTNEEAKKMFQKDAQVLTLRMRLSDKSKCQHKGCKKDDRYSIFVGDSTRLSTLAYNCCGNHLEKFIDKALADARKQIRGNYSQWCKEQKQKAREILK